MNDSDNEILVLNEQVKSTRNTFFNAETTIKSIQSFSKKKLTASNVEFLKTLSFVVEISEIANILNINKGESIFDDSIINTMPTRRLDIMTR